MKCSFVLLQYHYAAFVYTIWQCKAKLFTILFSWDFHTLIFHGILFTDISLSIDHHINIVHDAIFIGWVSTKT